MQTGTLRSQLLYPAAQSALSDEQLLAILDEVHLPDLADASAGWTPRTTGRSCCPWASSSAWPSPACWRTRPAW